MEMIMWPYCHGFPTPPHKCPSPNQPHTPRTLCSNKHNNSQRYTTYSTYNTINTLPKHHSSQISKMSSGNQTYALKVILDIHRQNIHLPPTNTATQTKERVVVQGGGNKWSLIHCHNWLHSVPFSRSAYCPIFCPWPKSAYGQKCPKTTA